jgi:hypothetical protein
MAHAGGSGSGGFSRPANFIEAKAMVLSENAILDVSAAGYTVPPIPKGAELADLIGRRW